MHYGMDEYNDTIILLKLSHFVNPHFYEYPYKNILHLKKTKMLFKQKKYSFCNVMYYIFIIFILSKQVCVDNIILLIYTLKGLIIIF